MTTPLLALEDLNVWFELPGGGELHAVRGVSFELEAGERFGLVGESGCGKTTAMLSIMGLLPPNATVAGEVRLDGENILARGEETVSPHRWNDIAMVFQGAMNAFNPVQTVGSQIEEPMHLHGVAEGKLARRQAEELLERVGIPKDRADRFPHEFSGGMRQRAAIAMALACEPKILLADEPTTALDVMVQAQILELLVSLAPISISRSSSSPTTSPSSPRSATAQRSCTPARSPSRPPSTLSSTHRSTRTRASSSRPRPISAQAASASRRFPARLRGSTSRSSGVPSSLAATARSHRARPRRRSSRRWASDM